MSPPVRVSHDAAPSNSRRRGDEKGFDVVLPQTVAGRTHVWHLYVIQTPERDRLRATLQEQRIATGLHYPVPLHQQPAYKSLGFGPGSFPVSEQVSRRVVSLPMYPELNEAQVDRVCKAVVAFHKAGS